MPAKRSFSPADLPTKAEDYHGSAGFIRTSPNLTARDVKSVNIEIGFDEALKLSLALQSCVQALNRYHRGTTKGRNMGVVLSVKLSNRAVSVIEAPVKPPGDI